MLYLKCTNEVQKTIGLKKANLAAASFSDAALGNWYVNRFKIGRKNVFIFMSDATLLSFILLQGKKPVTVTSLPLFLLGGLQQLLEMRSFSDLSISKVLQPYSVGLFAKTDSRSDLGSLNDLVNCYDHMIEFEGGLDHCNLTGIIMKVTDMPQRKLKWSTSWDVTTQRLGSY